MDRQLIHTLDGHYRQEWRREFPDLPAPSGVGEYIQRYARITRNCLSQQRSLRRRLCKKGRNGYLRFDEMTDYYLLFIRLSRLFTELADVFEDVPWHTKEKKIIAAYCQKVAEALPFWEEQFRRTADDLGRHRVDETTVESSSLVWTPPFSIIFSQRLSRS